MSAAVILFATCIVACLDAVYSQTAVVPLVIGQIQPAGTSFTFLGSVTLVRDGTNNIVVDTPSGSDANGRTTMLNGLAQNGLNPVQIQTLVITHGHPDHFGHDSLFTNARQLFNSFGHVDTTYSPLTYQNSMMQLTTNVQMWQTPGHTPQDVSVIVKNVPQRGTVAVVGDLIFDAADALNPATSQVGLAYNIPMLITSRNKVLCTSDYIVPGHGAMFQVTAQMRIVAQCAGGGGATNCAMNQVLVNGQCYTCPAGSTAVNNVCTAGTGGGGVTTCPPNQVLINNQCIPTTANQPCINVLCISGGDAQCRANSAPYTSCAYHNTLKNYYCCRP